MHHGNGESAAGPNGDDGTASPPAVQEEIRQSLLLHPTRKSILEIVQEKPGLNKNQMKEELGVGLKTLDHHLQKMLDAAFVQRYPSAQGKEHLYFRPEDEDLWENPRQRILFGRRPTRNVGMYIANHPGTSSEEIAEAFDLSVVTVRHHLRTLKEHSLIVSAKVGRQVEYHPLNELTSWVEELGDRYEQPW